MLLREGSGKEYIWNKDWSHPFLDLGITAEMGVRFYAHKPGVKVLVYQEVAA